MNKKEKEPNFNEIDERLFADGYVHSGQRKRYLKSLIKDIKKVFFQVFSNNGNSASRSTS